MSPKQEDAWAEWCASDEAEKLIGGEDRNHFDTARAAFLWAWESALRHQLLAQAPQAEPVHNTIV